MSAVASALSRAQDTAAAAAEIAELLAAACPGPSTVLLFATDSHRALLADLVNEVKARTGAGHVVGCSALGILTEAGEVEEGPGVAALALGPDAPDLHFAVPDAESRDAADVGRALGEALAAHGEPRAVMLMPSPALGWPQDVLTHLFEGLGSRPPVLGAGLSSGEGPDAPRVVVDGQEAAVPALALGVYGDTPVRYGLSHAMAPRGRTFVMSKTRGNRILELDGRPAREVLVETLGEEVAAGLGSGRPPVCMGLPADRDSAAEALEPGRYRVRGLAGVHPRSGALITHTPAPEGYRAGFVVADPEAAEEDLGRALEYLVGVGPGRPPKLAFLFDCCERGEGFYGRPGVDTATLRRVLPGVPTVGVFGSFELCPVDGQQDVHGYTGVVLLVG